MRDERAVDWRLVGRARAVYCAKIKQRENRRCWEDARASERRLTQEARAGIPVRVRGRLIRVLMLKQRGVRCVGAIEGNDRRGC